MAQSKEELDVARVACSRDLSYLCQKFLGYEHWDIVHEDINRFLSRPSRRKLILVPRGHLKTAIVTKGKAIQALLVDPNARVLIANQVWDKAREMLSEIKEYLETKSPLPLLFGTFKSERWNQDEIVIKQRRKALSAPSIGTTGVEAEMTSTHYDKIILDDLQGLQNTQTKEQRDKVKKFYRSVLNLLEPGGELIVVGTRWSPDDLYQEIIDKESKYYDIMVRRVVENGKLIFPKKFNLKFDEHWKTWKHVSEPTLDYINHLKSTLGSEFYGQYMNNPIDEEHQVFKRDYFQVWHKRPEHLNLVMTVDPAISLKRDGDYSAIIVSGMDEQYNIYVMDYVKGHWTPNQIIENMITTYMKWNTDVIGLETLGFQKTLKYALEEAMRKRNIYFPITEINTSNRLSKEMKIKALEPYYMQHKVFHASWMHDLEDELTAFPLGRHDDLIDAFSMGLAFLTPGDITKVREVPEGSWAFYSEAAKKASRPYKNFFHS